MKNIYDFFRTTRVVLTVLLKGFFMFAANKLQAQTLTPSQPDKDYARDDTVFITGTEFQADEIVSLKKHLI